MANNNLTQTQGMIVEMKGMIVEIKGRVSSVETSLSLMSEALKAQSADVKKIDAIERFSKKHQQELSTIESRQQEYRIKQLEREGMTASEITRVNDRVISMKYFALGLGCVTTILSIIALILTIKDKL